MRIVTRCDWDGLVSSTLITEVEPVSGIEFAHPREIESARAPFSADDIVLNLPYRPGLGIWFDHHFGDSQARSAPSALRGAYERADSCARVVYEHYGKGGWREKYRALIDETDRICAGALTLEDILRPRGWVKLSNTIEPRGGFRPGRDYFNELIEMIKTMSLDEILDSDLARTRLEEYFKRSTEFEKELRDRVRIEGSVALVDFRGVDHARASGNRFLIYALYPSASVSITAIDERANPSMTRVSLGVSLLNRSCSVDIGALAAEFGGGGNRRVGSFTAPSDLVDEALYDLARRLNESA